MDPILPLLALVGTAVFAVSGALMGNRRQMDIVGVSFVAAVTGVGGGTIRDLLLGRTPVSWVQEPTDILVCIGCAVLVSAFNRQLVGRRMDWLLWADAAGLALFAVLGASVALRAEAHPFVAVLFGAMSASFGGVIRDVMCGETPVLFSREIYITPALVGAAVFVALPVLPAEPRTLLAVAAGFGLRMAAIRYGWSIPFPRYRAGPTEESAPPD